MPSLEHLNIPQHVHDMPTDYELYLEYGEHFHLVKKIIYRNYLRTVLSERQSHRCCYCGRHTNDIPNSRLKATLEHVIPASQGGATDLWNLVIACSKCNNKRKDDYIPEQDEVILGRTNEEQFVRPYGAAADKWLDAYGNVI